MNPNKEDYFEEYIWLTTTKLSSIIRNGEYITGYGNTVALVELYKIDNVWVWWIWKTLVNEDLSISGRNNYFKIGVGDSRVPLIPEHLHKFYVDNKDFS